MRINQAHTTHHIQGAKKTSKDARMSTIAQGVPRLDFRPESHDFEQVLDDGRLSDLFKKNVAA